MKCHFLKLGLATNAFFLVGCGLCGDQVFSAKHSPNGRMNARVVERDCGATTSEYTLVVLRGRFSLLGFGETVIFSSRYGHPDLNLKWVGENRLIVTCSSCSEITSDVMRRAQGIQIQLTNGRPPS